MPTAPISPDKPLVASGSAKDVDNTGWIVNLMAAQKELLLAMIEGNDLRYDQRYQAQKEAIAAALNAADRAVQKAEIASEKRFEGVNEFRSAMLDQQRTFMPRTEAEVMMKNMDIRVDALTKQISDSSSQRARISQGWALALGAIGLISTILGVAAVLVGLARG